MFLDVCVSEARVCLCVCPQSVRGFDLVRTEGGHDPASVPAIRAHQVHQHVVGPRHAETQGVRLCGVRDPRGRAAQPRADERCHARREVIVLVDKIEYSNLTCYSYGISWSYKVS